MRNIASLAFALLVASLLGGCKDKAPQPVAKPVRKVVVPKGPRTTGNASRTTKVGWLNNIYTVDVKRVADKSLPLASDGSHDYYDNRITVRVLRQNGTVFLDRSFTKADFKEKVPEEYYTHGALLGIVLVGSEGSNLKFAASVGSPDTSSDENVPLIMTISKFGSVTVTRDESLE